MNLLFIQGGSRLKLADNGKWYTDGNFSKDVWERYMAVCDRLIIVLRRERKVYMAEEAEKKFNVVPTSDAIEIVALDDIYSPKYNIINPIVRARIHRTIADAVSKCDKAIIRSCSHYTVEAYKECVKQRKPYLLEVTGLIKEGLVHHSLLGRLTANYFENVFVKMARDSSHAIYVTEESLQRRYPSNGKMLGCSDVQLGDLDEKALANRLDKEQNAKTKIIVGTAAFLDVKWKGQEIVIKAIAELKTKGINNIYYELVGLGKGSRLRNLAEKLGITDRIIFLGAKPHEEIFEWLRHVDIYIQSSYQEGLCRSIVEAMSCACPVICSDIGGNYELIDRNFIFPCGDYEMLAKLIVKMRDRGTEQAQVNFEKAKRYNRDLLSERRTKFFKDFLNS